jgi:hypothetical protein
MTVTLDTGLFGPYGGRYVPEALIAALDELAQMHASIKDDPLFAAELNHLHKTYSGRPSILTEAHRFAEHCGGARVLLKREDLNHTKLIMSWVKRSSQNEWVRNASSLKLEQGSMAWHRQRPLLSWVLNALSIWVKKIQNVRRSTLRA